MLIINDKIKDISHYTVISNLSWLFRGSKYDKGLHYSKKVIVLLNLEKIHTPLCVDNENVLTIMPERVINSIVKFKDYHM